VTCGRIVDSPTRDSGFGPIAGQHSSTTGQEICSRSGCEAMPSHGTGEIAVDANIVDTPSAWPLKRESPEWGGCMLT
jgi:hypothetical protein